MEYIKSYLSDNIIASDLLISCKTAVKTYSAALTEASTPEVRETLRNHLDDAVNSHEKVLRFMEKKGWYQPNDMSAQIHLDLQTSTRAVNNTPSNTL